MKVVQAHSEPKVPVNSSTGNSSRGDVPPSDLISSVSSRGNSAPDVERRTPELVKGAQDDGVTVLGRDGGRDVSVEGDEEKSLLVNTSLV